MRARQTILEWLKRRFTSNDGRNGASQRMGGLLPQPGILFSTAYWSRRFYSPANSFRLFSASAIQLLATPAGAPP